ncbi:alpha/beta fold hydrolase [Iamia sp.]|uniref:alpha/beta fold hydrolase n=1 Tax=Iamia sp. TaxID=2722710 RepID=UPI002BCB9940|nr:alpha/beta fold hydrolase [Iamia sp.]HXH56461.1 alpha/beta fold hydrolase [Iamia sp.]
MGDTELAIDRGDVVLRGAATGRGPTVLLLHAGGERRQVWDPVASVLRHHGLRAVAFDLRGHGETGGPPGDLPRLAADVTAMIAGLDRPVAVVGASLGGLAAMAALADPPTAHHISGLVLVDVVPDSDPVRTRAWLARHGLDAGRHAVVDDILGRGPALRATVAATDVPILLVRGGTGSPLTDRDALRLLAANPRVHVSSTPGAGHLVARDEPLQLAAIIAECAARWAALALQRSLGAASLAHPGGMLLAHVERVHALTAAWDAPPPTQLAALCHATYGTDGFPHALLPPTRRERLAEVIGDEAEAIVYAYGACDRAHTYAHLGRDPLPLHDRFTGEVTPLTGPDLAAHALLTIANELDVARHASLPAGTTRQLRALVEGLAPHAPGAAAVALHDPVLT